MQTDQPFAVNGISKCRCLQSAVLFTLLVSCSLWLGIADTARAADAADDFPPTISVDDATLALKGTGKRKKVFITLYQAGLYSDQSSRDASAMISADAPMALRLKIISRFISAEKMQEAMNEGFQKSTSGNTAPIESEIVQFARGFAGEIKKQDMFDLIYQPGIGTMVIKNGATTVTVPGLAFKRALFGIWLSEDPVQESLKSGLLGN